MSSLAGLKKSYLIFRESTGFGHFRPAGSTFKVNFLNIQAKFKKSSVSFLEEVVRNIVLNFQPSLFKKVRVG